MASERVSEILKLKLRNREDLKAFVDYLNQERILTHSENEEITTTIDHSKQEQPAHLISILQRKGERCHAKILQHLLNQEQSSVETDGRL